MAYHRYWKDKPVAFSNSMNLRAYVETFYTKNILLNEGMLRNRPTTRTSSNLLGGLTCIYLLAWDQSTALRP